MLYRIHVTKAGRMVDPTTKDLPDAETAKHHAECLARSLTALRSNFRVDHLHDWHVGVTDENGKTLGVYQILKSSPASSPGRSQVQRRLRA